MDDEYEDVKCDFVFLTEIVELSDGDILIGMQQLDDDADNKRYPALEYHRLSDISLSYNESDNIELWAEEDDNEDQDT